MLNILETKRAVDHWKSAGLDLSPLLVRPDVQSSLYCTTTQDHGLSCCPR